MALDRAEAKRAITALAFCTAPTLPPGGQLSDGHTEWYEHLADGEVAALFTAPKDKARCGALCTCCRYCRRVTTPEQDASAQRRELAVSLRRLLPYLGSDDIISPTRGGRVAGLQTLQKIDPQTYGQNRSFLSGNVTRLSAYLRHGVLTLAEVRDYALQVVKNPIDTAKLINELAWRDYWQRLYAVLGEGVWDDQEAYKTGHAAGQYAPALPEDITAAETTLACMDSFTRDLHATGYLHNHARLWLASYIVHWRRIRWQAGASWFLEHLLDGDPASNNLSWQWVASTFASAPYIFNRENLERYTEGVYCKTCPHAGAGTCPFDQTYDALQDSLFPRLQSYAGHNTSASSQLYVSPTGKERSPGKPAGKPLFWHHTDGLNPASAHLEAAQGYPAIFIWDTGWLAPHRISMKRVLFLAECLQEMPGPIEVRVGEPASELLAAVRHFGADHVVALRTPDPRLKAAASAVERLVPVIWADPPQFAESERGIDLKRFSRYWKRAQASALQPTKSFLQRG